MNAFSKNEIAFKQSMSVQMASGRVVDLSSLSTSDIHWPDIVEAMVKLPRFNGSTPFIIYTTGQHCCHAFDLAPNAQRADAFLANFHEAFLGPIVMPAMSFIAHSHPDPKGLESAVESAKDKISEIIRSAAGLQAVADTTVNRIISAVELTLLATERRDLFPEAQEKFPLQLPAPARFVIKPWGQDRIRQELIKRLGELGLAGRF